METQTEEKTQQPEESKISSSVQAPPTEEPIILKKLYPHAQHDLDALFPEPSMKELLKDLVQTRQKNDRFLKRINLGEVNSEEEDESVKAP
jgi:hypothetical protein